MRPSLSPEQSKSRWSQPYYARLSHPGGSSWPPWGALRSPHWLQRGFPLAELKTFADDPPGKPGKRMGALASSQSPVARPSSWPSRWGFIKSTG